LKVGVPGQNGTPLETTIKKPSVTRQLFSWSIPSC
jgi:hypothetical protein